MSTVVHYDTLLCTVSKGHCGIWPMVFLRGGACLSAVCCPTLRLWENQRVSSYLAWPRGDMCSAPTAYWIGGCGHQKLACTYIFIMTSTYVHTRAILNTDTHTHSHTYTHTGGSIPRIVWIRTSCMYCVDCMPFGLALPIDWKHDR